jgi:hypothetical protein
MPRSLPPLIALALRSLVGPWQVFGQLGSLSLNMSECGVPVPEIREFVSGMCDRTQLGEDQVQALMATIAGLQDKADRDETRRKPPATTQGQGEGSEADVVRGSSSPGGSLDLDLENRLAMVGISTSDLPGLGTPPHTPPPLGGGEVVVPPQPPAGV